jgi:hypothetical protein
VLIICYYIAPWPESFGLCVWYVWGAMGDATNGVGSFQWVVRKLGSAWSLVVWKFVPHCLMWYIWRERNDWHFEDRERTILELKLLFFQTLFEWVVGLGICSIHSLVELIDLCTF